MKRCRTWDQWALVMWDGSVAVCESRKGAIEFKRYSDEQIIRVRVTEASKPPKAKKGKPRGKAKK